MRILVVTNDFPPRIGGIQTYVAEIVARMDATVTVLASTSPGFAEFDHDFRHDVIRVPTSVLLPTPALKRRVTRLVRDRRPDIVLFGAALPLALLGPSLERRTGTPYAAFTHGLEIAATRLPGGPALLRRIGSRAALVTAVSQWTADVLRPHLGSVGRIELLPSGVDTGRFHPRVSAAAVRERHRLGSAPVVVCVSRLVRRKGQDAVIRSLPKVAEEYPDVRFLVVGDGPDRRRLLALARRVTSPERVRFAGSVSEKELPSYFRAGDVFAMPCRSRKAGLEVEALGAVYLQAAAVGCPVVAGASGGAGEAVVDGDTGLVVDGRQVDQVANAILSILRAPDRGAAMGARGAARIRDRFTWDQVATRCRALLATAVTTACRTALPITGGSTRGPRRASRPSVQA